MQSGILYLKNYYQKIGLEIENWKKRGIFLATTSFTKSTGKKKKKKFMSAVRKNFIYKKNTIRSFL